MSRVIVLGIDGLDWPLLSSLMDDLPHFRQLASSGWAGEMPCIFPPDSIPSWVSIFTGLNPVEHGVIESVDYFRKDYRDFAPDTSAFRGRTFWDLAGAGGRRVIVVNPLMAYPPWEVNGVMATGPVFMSGETAACPPAIATEFDIPHLGGIVDFPEKHELGEFAEKTRAETERILQFTIDLMQARPWDLVFVSLLEMDRIFHFFWRYHDEGDPTHPGTGEHADVIREFHLFFDEALARLVDAAGDDTVVLIVSDHGHNRRATTLANINQILMEHGLLESRIRGPHLLSPRWHLEKAKNVVLETLHRLDLEDLSYRVARLLPWTRKLKKGDHLTSPSDSLAGASTFGGSNPFGGVEISRERCAAEGIDYESMRDRVISILLDTPGPEGEPLFVWARRREEIYTGPYIDRFPDVLYEMRPGFGTNWAVHVPRFQLNPRHRKISGGHRPNSVLVAGPLRGRRIVPERVTSLNIAATVLRVLGVEDAGCPGAPFIENDRSPS